MPKATIRIVDFKLDNVEMKLATMSVRAGELFVEEAKANVERADRVDELRKEDPIKNAEEIKRLTVTDKEWKERTATIVAESLNRSRWGLEGSDDKWTAELVLDNFDIPGMNAIYRKILAESGLIMPDDQRGGRSQGEAKAA